MSGALGTSFGGASQDYVRGRPSYPPEAVRWLVGAAAVQVVDVGAGTGKLTRVLVDLGHQVTAVDPDAAMLAALTQTVPGVPTEVGTAEQLPVPDASADVVVLGQAWHWVEPVRASAEVGRVVRPGGTLGLIWNIRDDSVPWVRALSEAMHGSAAERLIAGDGPRVGAPFGDLEPKTWRWTRPMTHDDVIAMVRSRSHYIAADSAGRAAIDANVAAVLAGQPGDTVDMPYVTHAFRARRD
ncbi:class I SAM-dependent methyltransferase [Demequina sp. B12]|uniref:class I SAM-dependent methyltransferase n=1 Tax=Demequina sp. B12 TaxID=2992757 RepID=UPI00237C023E|nr:class I SAM-dependent methyltransferase [Demequina sp. B12]MDE0572627.1 class I SAM-dependent methyltransferase [Demequina sp. B12]